MKKIALILFLASAFLSCKKDKEEDKTVISDNSVVTENNQMDNMFDDLYGTSEKGKRDNENTSNLRVGATECPTANVENSVITLDFGTEGCLYNNKSRKGKIQIQYTGKFMDKGTVITTTLVNYEVQNVLFGLGYVKVEGTQVVENLGEIDGKMTWSVKVSNGKVTHTDGSVSTWETTRKRVLLDAGNVLLPFDEVYAISGTSSGVTKKSINYSMTIDENDPLIFDWTCWFKSQMPKDGKINLFEEGVVDRSIDYGYQKDAAEQCDKSVTVTYGGYSFNLDL